MSIIKAKIEIHVTIDTDEYPVPADGKLTLTLQDDVQEAIEGSVPVEINVIKITKTAGKIYEEVRDYD